MPVLAVTLALTPATPSGAEPTLSCTPTNPKTLVFVAVEPRMTNAALSRLVDFGEPLALGGPQWQFIYLATCLDSVPAIRSMFGLVHSAQVLNADYREGSRLQVPPDGYLPDLDAGSLWNVARAIDAPDYWETGYLGQGIDVAVIDTGVTDNAGMFQSTLNDAKTHVNRLIDAHDLSFDSSEATNGSSAFDSRDGFGHGTHIAGIIAGLSQNIRLPLVRPTLRERQEFVQLAKQRFVGIAPASRIVNVRVGANNGAVDVSQVIAGIDWVVAHQHDQGMNIRVLNLSYGTDGTQGHLHDPLQAAIDNAWAHNIFVVVSAGNDGKTAPLLNPAYDPNVMAVGAIDSHQTAYDHDDTIADFSSRGTTSRKVDLVAPGQSITSLASSTSVVDLAYPDGRVGFNYMKGSGTSQAAAVTSGAAALVLSRWPSLTPDQLKAALMTSAGTIKGTNHNAAPLDKGVGRLDLARIWGSVDKVSHGVVATQHFVASLGDGSLEAARGTFHVGYTDGDGVDHVLQGDVDVTNTAGNYVSHTWRDEMFDSHTWRGGTWDSHTWRALGWSNGFWQDGTWESHAWRVGGWQ